MQTAGMGDLFLSKEFDFIPFGVLTVWLSPVMKSLDSSSGNTIHPWRKVQFEQSHSP